MTGSFNRSTFVPLSVATAAYTSPGTLSPFAGSVFPKVPVTPIPISAPKAARQRSAIERAWQHVSPAERRKCFGTFFDPWEKAPSNVPFLTAMTEYLESSQDRAENFR